MSVVLITTQKVSSKSVRGRERCLVSSSPMLSPLCAMLCSYVSYGSTDTHSLQLVGSETLAKQLAQQAQQKSS